MWGGGTRAGAVHQQVGKEFHTKTTCRAVRTLWLAGGQAHTLRHLSNPDPPPPTQSRLLRPVLPADSSPFLSSIELLVFRDKEGHEERSGVREARKSVLTHSAPVSTGGWACDRAWERGSDPLVLFLSSRDTAAPQQIRVPVPTEFIFSWRQTGQEKREFMPVRAPRTGLGAQEILKHWYLGVSPLSPSPSLQLP